MTSSQFCGNLVARAYALMLIFLGSVMFSGMGMILSGLVKDVEAASAIGNAIAHAKSVFSSSPQKNGYLEEQT